jgi:mannitol/fructose-specific phosphotransferase system IIA component (Ntr-type)
MIRQMLSTIATRLENREFVDDAPGTPNPKSATDKLKMEYAAVYKQMQKTPPPLVSLKKQVTSQVVLAALRCQATNGAEEEIINLHEILGDQREGRSTQWQPLASNPKTRSAWERFLASNTAINALFRFDYLSKHIAQGTGANERFHRQANEWTRTLTQARLHTLQLTLDLAIATYLTSPETVALNIHKEIMNEVKTSSYEYLTTCVPTPAVETVETLRKRGIPVALKSRLSVEEKQRVFESMAQQLQANDSISDDAMDEIIREALPNQAVKKVRTMLMAMINKYSTQLSNQRSLQGALQHGRRDAGHHGQRQRWR